MAHRALRPPRTYLPTHIEHAVLGPDPALLDPLAQIARAHALHRLAAASLDRAVAAARRRDDPAYQPVDWGTIGAVVGMTGAGAAKRWSSTVRDQT